MKLFKKSVKSDKPCSHPVSGFIYDFFRFVSFPDKKGFIEFMDFEIGLN